ncbi:MAG TPA: DivIVA domain-containing protein [Actinomycetota bacterium]
MTAGVRLTPEAIRDKTFTRARQGYRPGEVDQFLAQAADDLARLAECYASGSRTPAGLLGADEVETKLFHRAFRGYAMAEVDDFLDLVAADLGRMHRLVAEMVRVAQPQLELTPRVEPLPDRMTASDVASTTFTRIVRGYRMDEVDRFITLVARELARVEDNPDSAPRITAHDIGVTRFTLGPRGYAMYEVDSFLARLAAQLARAEAENGYPYDFPRYT